MKIVIATKNNKKAQLALSVFQETFPNEQVNVSNVDAKSDVPDTPWEEQTYQGAINRAKNLAKSNHDFDYYIGLETGLVERYGELFEEAWCYILDKKNKGYLGYSSGYLITKNIKTRIRRNEATNTKVLEVLDENTKDFIMYSGSTEIRAVSLKNAIEVALANLMNVNYEQSNR